MKKLLSTFIAIAITVFPTLALATTFPVLNDTPTSSTNGGTCNLSTVTNSHTVASGLSNSILINVISSDSGSASSTITGATYGGTAMTEAFYGDNTGKNSSYWVFYMVNPPAGTANVVDSFTGSGPCHRAVNYVVTGVDTNNPIDSHHETGAANGSNSASDNITTNTANDLVFDALFTSAAMTGTITWGAGQTEAYQFDPTASIAFAAGSYKTVGTAGATSTSLSWTGAAFGAAFGSFALSPTPDAPVTTKPKVPDIIMFD